MKKLIVALLSLVSFNTLASDRELREVYVQLDPKVQVVLTNAPCKMFTAAETVQLNLAYAQNMETGDRVFGCFTHEGDVVQIELIDQESSEHYSYKINAIHFKPRPTL